MVMLCMLCRLLGYDVIKNELLKVDYELQYCDLKSHCVQSDIITIHTCLTPETKYMIHG